MFAAAVLGGCGGGSASSSVSGEPTAGDAAGGTTDGPDSDGTRVLSLRVVYEVTPPPCDVTMAGLEPVRSEDGTCYFLHGAPLITDDDIARAKVYEEPGSVWSVVAYLDRGGKQRFRDVVRRYTNRSLAIVIDGVVVSAAVLQPGTEADAFQVNGDFDREQAVDVAARVSGVPAHEIEVVPTDL